LLLKDKTFPPPAATNECAYFETRTSWPSRAGSVAGQTLEQQVSDHRRLVKLLNWIAAKRKMNPKARYSPTLAVP